MAEKKNSTKQQHARKIDDRFDNFSELRRDLRVAGLESSNLIIGIDYTKSNLNQGYRSFGRKSLHDINSRCLNPYQRVIKSIYLTLDEFQEDPFIPMYGFGDLKTKDKSVFPILYNKDKQCADLQQIFDAYSKTTPTLTLSGPTNFAPLIKEAVKIVQENKQYYILLIITDGFVTVPKLTTDAIIQASNYPLSIIAVGVGDGPWDEMEKYDDELPERRFDNFQFVDYNKVINEATQDDETNDTLFAKAALMEIPDQFRAIKELGLLNWE